MFALQLQFMIINVSSALNNLYSHVYPGQYLCSSGSYSMPAATYPLQHQCLQLLVIMSSVVTSRALSLLFCIDATAHAAAASAARGHVFYEHLVG